MARFPVRLPPSALPRLNPAYVQNPVFHQQPQAPIHLSSNVVLRSGSSGSPPVAAFRNPMGQDMEILEIKFELSGALPVGNSLAVAFGGTITCELIYGSGIFKLTNGSIPVWNFGRAENLEAENKIDSTSNRIYCAYTWRLPRPMYVPADLTVVPNFVHTGFLPETINVRVGYSARAVTQKPKRVYLPFVDGWTSKSFNPIENAGTDQSSELDLVNDTNRVLHLQRITGRLLYIDPSGFSSEAQPSSFGSQYLMARVIDSYGRPIVRSFTPFRSVFGSLTRSWELEEVGALLDPGAYWRVFLKKASTAVAVAGAQGQAFVSMVGWREERV